MDDFEREICSCSERRCVLGGKLLYPRLDIVFYGSNHDLSHRKPHVLREPEEGYQLTIHHS